MAYQTWVYRRAWQTGNAEDVEVEQKSSRTRIFNFFDAPETKTNWQNH
jgi:hypothetical protein